jgi:hypothetical protein
MSRSLITAVALTLPLALGALGASARAEVSILDNDKTITVDCAKDPEISVLGNHVTVTATGVCSKITLSGNEGTVTGSAIAVFVSGNHNTVTLAAADDVSVTGSDNTVTLQKPVKRKAARVSNVGTHNHVTAPK